MDQRVNWAIATGIIALVIATLAFVCDLFGFNLEWLPVGDSLRSNARRIVFGLLLVLIAGSLWSMYSQSQSVQPAMPELGTQEMVAAYSTQTVQARAIATLESALESRDRALTSAQATQSAHTMLLSPLDLTPAAQATDFAIARSTVTRLVADVATLRAILVADIGFTQTPHPVFTRTPSPTTTARPTSTKTPTATPSSTPTNTLTATRTMMSTPAGIPAEAAVAASSPTRRPTFTPPPTATPSRAATPTMTTTQAPRVTTVATTQAHTSTPQPAHTSTPTATPVPTTTPTRQPTRTPTRQPTRTPTLQLTDTPTHQPTRTPTRQPSRTPTRRPSRTPTRQPSRASAPSATLTPQLRASATPTVTPTPTAVIGVPASAVASSESACSRDSRGNLVCYPAGNVIDGLEDTAWRASASRELWIEVEVQQLLVITQIDVLGGYVKIDPYDGTDRWEQNHRPRGVRVYLDDDVEGLHELADIRGWQSVGLQPQLARRVRLEIVDTYPPLVGNRPYVAISEVRVLGHQP